MASSPPTSGHLAPAARPRPGRSPLDDRIDGWISLPPEVCWQWPARVDSDGRAVAVASGRRMSAALAVWQAINGQLPADQRLFRTCVDLACVSVHHRVPCDRVGPRHYACPTCGASLTTAHLSGHLGAHRLIALVHALVGEARS